METTATRQIVQASKVRFILALIKILLILKNRHYVHMHTLILFFPVVQSCPEKYPYAFMWGEYCCKSAEEDRLYVPFDGCNGMSLSLNSVCCKHNEYQKCPGAGGCRNHRGITIGCSYYTHYFLKFKLNISIKIYKILK